MSLTSAHARLARGAKALRTAWEQAEPHWKDAVREEYERQLLLPLLEQSGAVLLAMENLAEILDKAKRECS